MTELTIHISGNKEEDRLLATAFDVVSSQGVLLAQGTASPQRPATVQLTDSTVKRVHVIGYSPSGRRALESRDLDGKAADVWLYVTDSPHEWLQWVAPFRPLSHLRKFEGVPKADRAIGRVWMTVWRYRGGRWAASPLNPTDHMGDDGIRQVVLDVPKSDVTLLQVGGDEVAWRLISLPPGGPVRVALTRNPDADPDTDSIDVTIGRVQPDNDLIMSYLSRGDFVEAARLGEAWQTADRLLYDKIDDPVSAAAGAYLLLKIDKLRPRNEWVRNLVNWFQYLADGPIIAAALELQSPSRSVGTVREYLRMAVARGVPVFALGAAILVETMAAVHRGARESRRFKDAYQSARALHQARTSLSTYFSFYGRSPVQPSWLRYKGPPDAPFADFNDLARSNTDSISNKRLDLDTGADLLPVLNQLPGVLSSDILARRGETLPGPNQSLIALAFSEDAELTAVPSAPPAGSWVGERSRNAFSIFDGSE